MNLVETIENKIEEFGLENINNNTTVFVNKEDLTDVSVADTDFNTFTNAHAAPARWFVTEWRDEMCIDTAQIEVFAEEIGE